MSIVFIFVKIIADCGLYLYIHYTIHIHVRLSMERRMATLMVHLRYGGGAFEGRIDPTKRWKLSIHFFLLSAVQATSCISTLLLAIMEGDETETLGKLFCFLGEVGQ